MDDEEFGSVHIDSPDNRWEKPDRAPAFDYWIYKYRRQKLSAEQNAFLSQLRDSLRDGTSLKCPGYYGYLSLLRDELIRSRTTAHPKNDHIRMVMNLISVYGYQDNDLLKMIAKERGLKSMHRVAIAPKEPTRWILPGQSLEYSQGIFTRGGFYWGNRLVINSYNSQVQAFVQAKKTIEGPIVSEYAIANSECIAGLPFSSLIEMPEPSKTAFLKFLQGEEIADKFAISYYLAGIEARLLADASISQEERKDLILYLHGLRNCPSIKRLDFDIQYNERYDFTSRIDNLVDFAMARFFAESPESVFPIETLRQMPILNRIHVALTLLQFDCNVEITDEMAQAVADTIWMPAELPDVFEEDFRREFKRELKYQSTKRTDYEDTKEPEYYPIKGEIGYAPHNTLEEILKKPAIRFSQQCNRKLGKVKAAYRSLKYDLTYFLAVKQRGSGLLTQKYYLPPWCDDDKLPGFKELKASMGLADDEPFRMTSVLALMEKLEMRLPVQGTEYVDDTTLDYLRQNLKILGLNMGAATAGTMKLRYDDNVGLFSSEHSHVPNRGTALVSLFLVGWLINIDGAKAADFALIDQWIDEHWSRNKWVIAAKATLRWLAQRKITMTQKRKQKVATLTGFYNKRDELLPLLLQLAGGATVSPKRMKRLEIIYTLIDLDPANIHSDLHRLVTTAAPGKSKKGTTDSSKAKTTIDKGLLREMTESTQKAQKILAQVFAEDSAPEKEESAKKKSKEEPPEIKILRKLAQKDTWTRAELEELCKHEGKTPADLLETLNDLAYERVDEPVVEEDDDQIAIDQAVAAQLLS